MFGAWQRYATRVAALALASALLPYWAPPANASPAVTTTVDAPCSQIHLLTLSNHPVPPNDPNAGPPDEIYSGPGGTAAVVGHLPPEDPKDRLHPSAEFDVVGSHAGFLLVRNVRVPGSNTIAFAGPGWIGGSLAYGTPASPLRSAPNASASIVEQFPPNADPDGIVLQTVLGCRGTWTNVMLVGRTSPSKFGWVSTMCPSQGAPCAPKPAADAIDLDGAYAALDHDRGDQIVGECLDPSVAREANLPPLAHIKASYAMSTVRLTSGPVIYIAKERRCAVEQPNDTSDHPLIELAYVSSGGSFRVAYSGITAQAPVFGTDWSLVTGDSTGGEVQRTVYKFDGTTYRQVRQEKLADTSTGEILRDPIPLHFSAGASSITVSGTVRHFFVRYAVDAAAGQTMIVDAHAASGKVRAYLTCLSCDKMHEMELDSSGVSWSRRLPIAATYGVVVENAPGSSLATYSLTVTIH